MKHILITLLALFSISSAVMADNCPTIQALRANTNTSVLSYQGHLYTGHAVAACANYSLTCARATFSFAVIKTALVGPLKKLAVCFYDGASDNLVAEIKDGHAEKVMKRISLEWFPHAPYHNSAICLTKDTRACTFKEIQAPVL